MIITHEFMRHCLVYPSRAQQIIDGNSGLLLLLVSQLVFPHVSGQILHFIGATSRVKMRVDVDVSQYCDSQSLMTPAPAPAPRPISLYAALVSPICRPAVDKSALSMCVTSMCVCVCLASVVYPSSTRLLGVIARQAWLSLLPLLLLPLTCRRSNKMFVDVVDAWLWIYDTLVIAVVSFR